MPIYEYECLQCKKIFEVLVSSLSTKVNCVHCNGNDLQRKFSAFGMKSGGKFVSSSGGCDCGSNSCGSCSSHNCHSCHN